MSVVKISSDAETLLFSMDEEHIKTRPHSCCREHAQGDKPIETIASLMQSAERLHREMKKIAQDNTKWRDVIVNAATKKLPPCRCGCMDDPPPEPVCPGKPQGGPGIQDDQLHERCLASIQQEVELSKHEQHLWNLKMELERFRSSWAGQEPEAIPKTDAVPSPEQLMHLLEASSRRLQQRLRQQYQEEEERDQPAAAASTSQH